MSLHVFSLMVKIKSFNFGYRFNVYDRVVAVRIMWSVVAAYAGERSFYIKFNWPFLGADFKPNLHHILLNYCHRDYCSLPFRSSKATKKKYGMFMSNK
jgi:hypothetical protein